MSQSYLQGINPPDFRLRRRVNGLAALLAAIFLAAAKEEIR